MTETKDTIRNSSLSDKEKQPHFTAYKEDIKNLPAILARFVPKGFTAIDTISGDLNLDPIPDMIMVLKTNGEDTSYEELNRPLLVLVGKTDGTYQLVAQNDSIVYCISCGGPMGDPYMGVVIKKGFFSIEHYGGSNSRWETTITFRYAPNERTWNLHKLVHESWHALNPEKRDSKIYTKKDFGKKISFKEFRVGYGC